LAIDFTNIEYLKSGNGKQRLVYQLLTENGIMQKLHKYDPLLAGTIPINIDLETSDIDIICYCKDYNSFISDITAIFSTYEDFSIRERVGADAVVATFRLSGYMIEVFAQNIPSHRQNAFRHMITENDLLIEHGENFRKRIIALKRQGYKTEPAFAYALGLKGDPYKALLEYRKKP
jgi:hypothetical protein